MIAGFVEALGGFGMALTALALQLSIFIAAAWLGVRVGGRTGSSWLGWVAFFAALALLFAVFHEPMSRLGVFADGF